MTDQQLNSEQRGGLTLIEAAVGILVIVLLAGIIVPAIQHSRASATKLECLNSIRNLGIGIQNVLSQSNGQFPLLTSTLTVHDGPKDGTMEVGWPVGIIPVLDASGFYREIKSRSVVTNGIGRMSESNKIWLKVFTCPADSDSFGKPGGLSYVANAGFISSEVWGRPETPVLFHQPYLINWKGSTTAPYRSADGTSATGDPSSIDADIALATGVLWRTVGDPKQKLSGPSLDDISEGDGIGTTILLTENLGAGLWYSSDVNQIAFGIRVPVSDSNFAPSVGAEKPYGQFDSALSLNTDFPGSTFRSVSSESWINQRAPDGTPRPSSRHRGGVNAIMCDGSARFLNARIDPNVYARLVTSNGHFFHEKPLLISDF